MENILKIAENKGIQYTEIKTSSMKNNYIEILDKNLKDISQGNAKIYSIRILYRNKIGLAYSYKEDYKKLLNMAIINAKASDKKIQLKEFNTTKKDIKTKFKKTLDISFEEKIKDILKLDDRTKHKKIKSLKLIYLDSKIKNKIINSENSVLSWDDVNSTFISEAYAKQNSKIEKYTTLSRIKGGYENMDNATKKVQKSMDIAEKLLTAKLAKGGHFDTIADQKLTGVMAHEAVGHACEADLVLNQVSLLQPDQIGKMIGNENLTISDDNTAKEWGWTPFDSEGVVGKKTILIKKGILIGYMHNRETANILNAEPTGNGRTQNYSLKPIPRMTNTLIEKGDSSYNEMLQEIKKGYYLKQSKGGEVNPATGEFLFNAQYGYFIKNGEIQHMVKGVSLCGNILTTLHNISLIANDLVYGEGTCGKDGQFVPVSHGSPHILIKNAKIGGSK